MKLKRKRKIKKIRVKVFKDISGEETSSKVPTNTPRVFHVKTRWTRRVYVVPTSFQIGIRAV